jgi:hypothetical protein
MTAITFPLKKFPGQVEHHHICFTGRLTAFPKILIALIFFQLTIGVINKISFNELFISTVPLLFIIIAFTNYYIIFRSRENEYSSLPLKKLSEIYSRDKKYFKITLIISFVIAFSVTLYCMFFISVGSILTSLLNSVLLISFFSGLLTRGIYSVSQVHRVLFEMLSIESMFLLGSNISVNISGMLVIFGLIIFLTNIYKLSKFSLFNLLQQIIS